MSQTVIETEFVKWKRVLHTEFSSLDVDYQTWVAINDLNKAQDGRFQTAPHFWNSVHRAYNDRLILGVWAALADRDSKSMSLRQMLRYCRSNLSALFDFRRVKKRVATSRGEMDPFEIAHWDDVIRENAIDEAMLDSLDAKLASVDSVLESLRGWRNKVLAHRDRRYVTGDMSVSDEFGLKPSDIRQSIDLGGEILHSISLGFELTDLRIGVFSSIPQQIQDMPKRTSG